MGWDSWGREGGKAGAGAGAGMQGQGCRDRNALLLCCSVFLAAAAAAGGTKALRRSRAPAPFVAVY